MNNKIYIAGKITGDPEYKTKFKDAAAKLIQCRRNCTQKKPCGNCVFKDRDYLTSCRIKYIFPQELVIGNPVDFVCENKPYWLIMIRCLKQLRRCTYAYFLNDWNDSRGARCEHRWAIRWKKQIIYQK